MAFDIATLLALTGSKSPDAGGGTSANYDKLRNILMMNALLGQGGGQGSNTRSPFGGSGAGGGIGDSIAGVADSYRQQQMMQQLMGGGSGKGSNFGSGSTRGGIANIFGPSSFDSISNAPGQSGNFGGLAW